MDFDSRFTWWLHTDVKTRHTASLTEVTHTLLFEPASLLDEANERSDSCAGADHDYWVGGFEGQAELWLADIHRNSGLVSIVSNQFVFQPVSCDTLVDAASLGLVLHNYGTDVDAVGVNLFRREEIVIFFQLQTLFLIWIWQKRITLEEEAME